MRSKAAMILCLALAGCLGKKEIARARQSAYQVDFAQVWQVVTEETRRRYTPPEMQIDDPVVGVLKSSWVKVGTDDDDRLRSTNQASVNPESRINAAEGLGAIMLQIEVKVVGGPPWQVIVEGKSARYVPNLAQFIPYSRGGADEPAVIQSRIDGLTVAIYKRLKQHAVVITGPAPSGKRALDVQKFGDVPPEAARLVGTVQAAARKREAELLRPLLAPDFVWSEGAGGSAEAAIALWGADPTLLSQLATLLEKGCGLHKAEKTVTCPAAAAPDASGVGPRAGFRQAADGWHFAFFLRE